MASSQVRRSGAYVVVLILVLVIALLEIKQPSKWFRLTSLLAAVALYLVFVNNQVTPRAWRDLEEKWKQEHPPRDAN
jgi:hypothetical protein